MKILLILVVCFIVWCAWKLFARPSVKLDGIVADKDLIPARTRRPQVPFADESGDPQKLQVQPPVPQGEVSEQIKNGDQGAARGSGRSGGAYVTTSARSLEAPPGPAEGVRVQNPRTKAQFSPESLLKFAADYNAKELQLAKEQYDLFVVTDGQKLLDWVACLMQKEANQGNNDLALSVDWSTRKFSAWGARLTPTYFDVPFATSWGPLSMQIEMITNFIADHFRKQMFHVVVQTIEGNYSRRDSTPRKTRVEISWDRKPSSALPKEEVQSTAAGSSPIRSEIRPFSTARGEPSYQTAPLIEYGRSFQERAADLFRCVEDRVGRSKAKAYKGSYSIFSAGGSSTASKIIIYQDGLGKTNGDWPCLSDGVYVLIRAEIFKRPAWKKVSPTVPKMAALIDPTKTIGIAPNHFERFSYFGLPGRWEKEEVADFIAICSKIL